MTRQSRNPASDLLRAGKEALYGPCRCGAGPIPRWAVPHCGTIRGSSSRLLEARLRSACAGFGARAASSPSSFEFSRHVCTPHKRALLAFHLDRPHMRSRHSVIAFCTAHVLNALGAPIASFISQLTRHERPNRGRHHATSRRGARSRQRDFASEDTPDGRFCRKNFDAALVGSVFRCAYPRSGPLRKRRNNSVTSRGGRSHRAQLCGPAAPCLAPLP